MNLAKTEKKVSVLAFAAVTLDPFTDVGRHSSLSTFLQVCCLVLRVTRAFRMGVRALGIITPNEKSSVMKRVIAQEQVTAYGDEFSQVKNG